MATRIGIRELVEFVLRSGNLGDSQTSQNTALQGAMIHRRLQKSRDADYQSEVYLKKTVVMNVTDFLIAGRADGVVIKDDSLLIEEIKTSDTNFADLPDSTLKLYWGQVKVYGYLLLQDQKLDQVTLRLTYYQVKTDKITTTDQTFTRSELDTFFTSLTDEYTEWLKLRAELRLKRNASIVDLPFPFSQYRTGQRELAVAVYKTIRLQKRLFVEAPTGTGKTISTMYPAIKAMGEDNFQRLFYLTAKQSTRQVAEEAVDLLSSKGLRLKSITLTAKEKIQFPEEADLTPEENPFMIGYYDRLKPALRDILSTTKQYSRTAIETYARKYTLDPFEFSLDLSLFCDVIICDYNYLFDPQVYLQRFFSAEDPDNFFLVDEVHNLVSRSRDMYSAEISDSAIAGILKTARSDRTQLGDQLKKALRKLRKAFTAINQTVLIDENRTTAVSADPPERLIRALQIFIESINDWLEQQPVNPLQKQVLDFYFTCLSFNKIADLFDESFETRYVAEGHQLVVKELCLDASKFLNAALNLGGGAVLFSATLSPISYYQDVLGGQDDSLAYQLPSPFPPKNQAILVTDYIATTYRQRQTSLPAIITSLTAMITARQGNYLCFCPSYGYLETVATAFKKANPTIQVVQQTTQMQEKDRQDFLAQFKSDPAETLVGFCVLGGIFSEGIDLKGSRLIGVAIVSVGLPGLNPETNLIRDYFERSNGHGFEYAYQLPGMNNVLQAAGRLIRGARDTGIILLLDQRFGEHRYTHLFPEHWQYYRQVASTTELAATIQNFWQQQEEPDEN